MLAGMHIAAGPKLAAAVANAGGFGSIGGLGYTPDELREQISELKSYLDDPNAPFGVDLLLPQVGGTARPTKYVFAPFPSPGVLGTEQLIMSERKATTTQRASWMS